MGFGVSDIRTPKLTPPERHQFRPAQLARPDHSGQGGGIVTSDGSRDNRRCHSAMIVCGATAVILARKNGRPSKENRSGASRDPARHMTPWQGVPEAVSWIPHPTSHRGRNAGPQVVRRAYRSERPRPLTRGVHIRIALVKRFDALGTAKIVRRT